MSVIVSVTKLHKKIQHGLINARKLIFTTEFLWDWCAIAFIFSSLCARYNNKRNKLLSKQPVCITFLIWQHVSTSGGYLHAGSTEYIQGTMCNYIKFWIEISILQFYKISVVMSDQLYTIEG